LIRSVVLAAAILTLVLSAPAQAAEQGFGVIEGWLINGTEDGSTVADQDVTLRIYLDSTEVDSSVAKTDAEGRFVFDSLDTKPGYSYQVWLNYQGAEYASEWLGFGENETSKSVEVIVYDSTTSAEAIKVEVLQTIMVVEEGSLFTEEYFLFVNEGDRTYIGSQEIDGGNETLRFSLPEKATQLYYSLGLMECCAVVTGEGFVDTMPVMPGSKEVGYGYRVDYGSDTYTFSKRVNYPTASFVLYVQGEAVEVSSDQLTAGELQHTEGPRVVYLRGDNLAPGTTLAINVSGLPEAEDQGTHRWALLGLTFLGGGIVVGYVLVKGRLQPARAKADSAGELDQQRQRLLSEIAQLDDDFEGGGISEEVYRRMRSERKAQLVELMRRLGRGSGGR
jgi:hypothetical protein